MNMQYPFHRDFYYVMLESIKINSVTFLLGTRKCGKTVCLQQLSKTLPNSSYINFKIIPSFESKIEVFREILNAITDNEEHIFLLDEITYVPDAEARICEIANKLTQINNNKTKMVFTGSQSVALDAWANRAFAGNVGKVYVDFLTYSEFLRYKGLTEISSGTYNRFLYEVSDFYKFQSLKDYLESCLEETIISNINATNYIFDNECDLIRDKVDLLVNICYQTMFTLHNQVNANAFFKDNKLKDTIIGAFHETCKKIENDSIAKKIETSFIGSYNNIRSQDLETLKQAFVFLKKTGLITITPIARDLENIPDVYRSMRLEDSDFDCKEDLFKKFNITINYPMFYIQILKDVLKDDMPDLLPGMILGSIVECHIRGMLPAGFEFHPLADEQEIDYINLTNCVAMELTIAEKHKLCFDLLPEYFKCTCLTKNENKEENGIHHIDYCTYLYNLSQEKYLSHHAQINISSIEGAVKDISNELEI